MTRYDSMLSKAQELIAKEDFKNDASKTHLDKMRRLRNLVERINELIPLIENRKGLQKFMAKFINNDEKELENKIAECALLVTRLSGCEICRCIKCSYSEKCKYSCRICPDTGTVVFCNNSFCIRSFTGWIITPQTTGTQIRYNVLYMATSLNSGRHYILLENRVDLGRGLCTYDRKTQAMSPVNSNDIEGMQVKQLLSSLK